VRLAALKARVRVGLIEAALALGEIHRLGLYKLEADTFAEFAEREFGFGRAHAYRLCDWADLVCTLVGDGDGGCLQFGDTLLAGRIPSEGQARVLKRLPPSRLNEVHDAITARRKGYLSLSAAGLAAEIEKLVGPSESAFARAVAAADADDAESEPVRPAGWRERLDEEVERIRAGRSPKERAKVVADLVAAEPELVAQGWKPPTPHNPRPGKGPDEVMRRLLESMQDRAVEFYRVSRDWPLDDNHRQLAENVIRLVTSAIAEGEGDDEIREILDAGRPGKTRIPPKVSGSRLHRLYRTPKPRPTFHDRRIRVMEAVGRLEADLPPTIGDEIDVVDVAYLDQDLEILAEWTALWQAATRLRLRNRETIRKLRAKADSTTFPEEAALLRAKADELESGLHELEAPRPLPPNRYET